MGSTYTNTAGSWAAGDYYGTSNQVNLMATLNNTFYITGIQFEVGDKATPFEHRLYADELRRCQRYYAVKENNTGQSKYFAQPLQVYNSTSVYGMIADFPAPMRAVPTGSQTGTFGAYTAASGNGNFSTNIPNFFTTNEGWGTGGWSGSGMTAGDAAVMYTHDGAKLIADAEL